MAAKIRIKNQSGIPLVRFRGLLFDPNHQISVDLANGVAESISNVPNGMVVLAAYRVPDQQLLDTIRYPVSDSQGFAAFLLADPTNADQPYRMVGEAFVIS